MTTQTLSQNAEANRNFALACTLSTLSLDALRELAHGLTPADRLYQPVLSELQRRFLTTTTEVEELRSLLRGLHHIAH